MLADLHLHLYGCIRARELLHHLSSRKRVLWDWYEREMKTAYGIVPPIREVVEQYRNGNAVASTAFEKLFIFGDEDSGIQRFQAKFSLLHVGSARVDRESTVAELGEEVAEFASAVRADHIRQGVSYAEFRIRLGADLDAPRDRMVLDTLLAAYNGSGVGITERLVIALSRLDPWRGWERVQELALAPYGSALTGIDFCDVEEGYPPKDKAAFFSAVHEFNSAHPERALAILYHVGESFSDKSLESSIRWVQQAAELGAHRLGHAIALGVDPFVFGVHARRELVAERKDQIAYDLEHCDQLRAAGITIDPSALRHELQELASVPASTFMTVRYNDARLEEVRRRQQYAMRCVRSTGAVIEVCPTSNRRVGGIERPADHPVHQFLSAGLPIVVCSDDPGIFGTTLHDEVEWVCKHTGGGVDLRRELLETARNSRSEILAGRVNR